MQEIFIRSLKNITEVNFTGFPLRICVTKIIFFV